MKLTYLCVKFLWGTKRETLITFKFLNYMAIRKILLLGNPRLYEISSPVQKEELENLKGLFTDLHDTLMEFRNRYGKGRAIAAPQIGVMKRVIYIHVHRHQIIINPVITDKNSEILELWDDCMSFPNLLVKIHRHEKCKITYLNENWDKHENIIEGDLSELLQHEVDHLDGILAVDHALDKKSFKLAIDNSILY
jgi:peptide deformylase